jgi:hypothetical protein
MSLFFIKIMALGIKSISDIEVGDILYATKQCHAFVAPDTSSKAYVYFEETVGEVLDTNVDGIDTEDYNNYIEVQVGAETLYVIYDVMVLEFRANPDNDYPKKETSSVAQFDVKKGVDTLLKILGVNKQTTDKDVTDKLGNDTGGGTKDNGKDSLPQDDTPWYQKYLLYIIIGIILLVVLLYFLLRKPKIIPGENVVQALPAPPSLQGTKVPKPLKMT